jgi:hypothetical protein
MIRLRSEAVKLIMTKLLEVQLALIHSGPFDNDGRVKKNFGGRGCSKCLDLWFGCITRGVIRPDSLEPTIVGGLPHLSGLTMLDPTKYHESLEKLCTLVESVQKKLCEYVGCDRTCWPPQLIGRKAVEDLISSGLREPLGGTVREGNRLA